MAPAGGDAASDERPFQPVLNKKQRRALARAMHSHRERLVFIKSVIKSVSNTSIIKSV